MFAENSRKIGQIITDHFFGGVVVVQIPTVLRVQGQGNGWGYWLVPVVGAIRGQGKCCKVDSKRSVYLWCWKAQFLHHGTSNSDGIGQFLPLAINGLVDGCL